MTTRDPAVTDQPRVRPSRRALLLAGPGMAVAFVGGPILAWILGPSAQWTADGFNALGSILHASIALGSLLGLGFLWPLRTSATHRVQRAGLGLFAIALLAMAGVNAVEIAYAELPVAVELLGLGFLFVLPMAWLVHGTGDVVAGYRRRGIASLALWVAYFSIWVYSLQLGSVPVFVGVSWLVLVSAWALVQYASARK